MVQSLEAGDRLRQVVRPLAAKSQHLGVPPAFSVWPEAATTALTRGLLAFSEALASEDVVYLPLAWNDLGPIVLDSARDLACAVEGARGWPEQFVVSTADGAEGIWLEYQANEAAHGEPYPYQLTIWGDSWQRLAQATLPFELTRP